jgi:hypothetical protein
MSESKNDDFSDLLAIVLSMAFWARKAHVRMSALRAIVDKHIQISPEEWAEATAQAESNLPVDLKSQAVDLAAIRALLDKLSRT